MAFSAALESIELLAGSAARIVVNERAAIVIINENVHIAPVGSKVLAEKARSQRQLHRAGAPDF